MARKKPHDFGIYVRRKRVEAGVSMRAAARVLDVSAVYLGEVERGLRPPLKKEHWEALMQAVPTIEKRDLERLTLKTRPVQMDLRDKPPVYQDLAMALARRIEESSISKSDMDKIMSILRRDDG